MSWDPLGPVPWHHIVSYGYHHQLDRDMIGVLELVVRELDEEYLKIQREEQRRRRRQPATKRRG